MDNSIPCQDSCGRSGGCHRTAGEGADNSMKMNGEKPGRRRCVTDEPMFIEPGLMGTPLASPVRRAAAFVADLAIVLLLVISSIAAVNVFRHPSLLKASSEYFGAEPGADRDAEMRAVLEARDDSALSAYVQSHRMNIVMDLDASESKFDEKSGMLRLGSDVVTGVRSFATGVPLFIAYFTILTWAMKGRTPGKALAGIRVKRLDGRKLNLWDSFGRAGGYAASAATGFVGFLEAFWHPNRQTIHDRIAGTVVTRERRARREKAVIADAP
jgi:uncharacterized RDD family membrane protein YckC